ncbi:MAG: SCP2 sterol-binding domain-containing protein [Acidobacteriota bacterium]|nr:SCP2 sterol-binding domain-containing protein [Blastocatellia bacterium]MDW8413053.1 SCP2 sterol-binding domain-containing protein [Acidobacteriota bacterium]
MPTVPEVFAEMKKKYVKGKMKKDCTYYFSLEDYKYTVTFEGGRILIEEGKTVDEADCVLKTSPEMFVKMWEGYKPSMMEFMSGKVKTNNPTLLQEFVKAFN